MAKTTIDTWNPEFLKLSPIFNSIRDVSQPFTHHDLWPTLEQFADEFDQDKILSSNGKRIQPVAQGEAPEKFDELYESRIFLKGELQTRLENWHDFFNAMCWLQFPQTKAALNALHFENARTREPGSNRSPLENAITLFDECGAVIVADDEKYLELIRQHEWKKIFREHKEIWGKHIQCYVFGHAMYEKALTPYIGMTTHSVLLTKPAAFFENNHATQLAELDLQLAKIWSDKEIKKTKDLQPLPLLGIPDWHTAQTENFYNDKNYFRQKK